MTPPYRTPGVQKEYPPDPPPPRLDDARLRRLLLERLRALGEPYPAVEIRVHPDDFVRLLLQAHVKMTADEHEMLFCGARFVADPTVSPDEPVIERIKETP